jgi:hypothetical protein
MSARDSFPVLKSKILFFFVHVVRLPIQICSQGFSWHQDLWFPQAVRPMARFPRSRRRWFSHFQFGSSPRVSVLTSFLLVSLWCRGLGFNSLGPCTIRFGFTEASSNMLTLPILLCPSSRVQSLLSSICVECARVSSLRILQPPISRLVFSKCLAVLPWWILGHAYEVFDEMCVRWWEVCWSDFGYRVFAWDCCLQRVVLPL